MTTGQLRAKAASKAVGRTEAQKNRAFGPTVGQFRPRPESRRGYAKDEGIRGGELPGRQYV